MIHSSKTQLAANKIGPRLPNIVVVDARFDAYKQLAQSERLGKLNLHFRASGAEAIRLARFQRVDAWLIATELDDMSGNDLVELLQRKSDSAGRQSDKIALISPKKTSLQQLARLKRGSLEIGADAVLSHPISLRDLEEILGVNDQGQQVRLAGAMGSCIGLSVAVDAAFISIALLIVG